ncbi:glycosyltransferase [Sphingomonas sp. Leaf412]|uniref:glycosyltransferase n=1 Tax=Sphingomonas sp. Leaf412 TaxID=1736370 RepID=UPI00138F041B|nr:glycosyltransferase [Sphingomonas sp. Leaf412]
MTIAIATYDQAHFLADALRSAMAQDRPADEIIVVDDGSHDDPASVVRDFPGVVLIRQENQGLAAARNTALAAAAGDAILFLDADDLLLPAALSTALACRARHPGAALVYGGHRRVDAAGGVLDAAKFTATGADPHADLLRGNAIGMHATVLYNRAMLAAAGGFDPALKKCEDYDVYLRLSRTHAIAHHPDIVADYRIHGTNMSGDSRAMLRWVERVRRRYRPTGADRGRWDTAWREGGRIWRDHYAGEILARSGNGAAIDRGIGIMTATAMAPRTAGRRWRATLRRRIAAALTPEMKHRLKRIAGRPSSPPLGRVRMGDLDRTSPISPDFGFDRGSPVDRHYIEHFLAGARADIRGRVLEIGDAAYSRRFGSGITRQDVLHVDIDAPGATIAGDMSQAGILPRDAFDCMIVTQTLHLIYDMRAALRQMHDALAPGGTLLLTVPGITSIDRGEWGDTWFWSLTRQSVTRLMAEFFDPADVEIAAHGNVYAATCFIQGMALEEVDRAKLEHRDASYPVVVTVRARRARP